MNAIAYQIKRTSDQEVLLEGIVRDVYDSIYPAQIEPYLTEEFPKLPYSVELRDFNVDGLTLERKHFSISWEQVISPN